MRIKKGDIVGRISYNKDIIFVVDKILKNKNGASFAILKGITIRVEADSPIQDLEFIDRSIVYRAIQRMDNRLDERAEEYLQSLKRTDVNSPFIYTGKILHLDGDRKYSEKSVKYYKKLGLNAIVKNIAENRQAQVVVPLLNRYNPDILVITGHDAMLKNGRNYNNLYNYRNSKHFINAVKEARKWGDNSNKLVIFAGACQSFFEAIMQAGADFASSPGRILIDFIDPIIVAEKIATTDEYVFVSSYEIIKEIKEGPKGVGGIGARGKKRIIR